MLALFSIYPLVFFLTLRKSIFRGAVLHNILRMAGDAPELVTADLSTASLNTAFRVLAGRGPRPTRGAVPRFRAGLLPVGAHDGNGSLQFANLVTQLAHRIIQRVIRCPGEGGSVRFAASCATPDAVHAITLINITHRNKNSTQRFSLLLMSPPVLCTLFWI